MVRLWRWMSEECSRTDTRVELRSWNDNWRQLAELMSRVRPPCDMPAVNVYAHGRGAGYGVMELARQLRRRGISVRQMVLSDPTRRWTGQWLRWLTRTPAAAIEVPDNVVRVVWFRRRGRPAGGDVVAQDAGRTMIEPEAWSDVPQQYMDDLRAFHLECERTARNVR